MPMTPLEKTFLRQNYFVWEGENRNSSSKNKQFEQKTIIWTTERGATNDGNLYEHLHRTSSSKYKIHGIKEISYFPPKKMKSEICRNNYQKTPVFCKCSCGFLKVPIPKKNYLFLEKKLFFFSLRLNEFLRFFSLHSNIWWEALLLYIRYTSQFTYFAFFSVTFISNNYQQHFLPLPNTAIMLGKTDELYVFCVDF